MDKDKIDLNAPAFGDGAQKVTELEAEVEPTEEVVTEPVVEEVQEASEEESKVPYSRFKKFHDDAKRYEREALEWKAKAEALAQVSKEEEATDELPHYWVKLYGDSPESAEAWKIQQHQNELLKKEARQEAIKAIEESRREEDNRTKENLDIIDGNLEALASYIGRDLTAKEESAILDIVDEYTPKDENDNYLGAILPFDKAWEIYQLKLQATNAPKKTARDNVADLTGTPAPQGNQDKEESDKNFNPLDWNAWRKRV